MKGLFPLVFGRTGGYPFDAFTNLKSEISETFVSRFIDLNREIETRKSCLMEKLYREIKNESNGQRKNEILNFKRDIFNKRQSAISTFSSLRFKKEIEIDIKEYFKTRNELENLVQQYITIFSSEELANVEILKQLTDLFFFRNGLIFSSQVLFQELGKRPLARTANSTVISLLKYLTRSVAKTTPFSTFNSVFFLHKKLDNFTSNEIIKNSNIQVTNLFYYYLKSYLLKETCFRDLLTVKINSTVWVENGLVDTLNFFQNDGNNESFKKLKLSSTLLEIKNLLDSTDFTYGKFISKLRQASNESKSSVEEFVKTLLTEGFLKVVFPVSWTNKNWILELITFLRHRQISKEFDDLEALLEAIAKTIVSLENCYDAGRRYAIISECHSNVLDFFKTSDSSNVFLKKVSAQELFYEDHFLSTQESISETMIMELVSDVKEAFLRLNNIPVKRLRRISLARSLEIEINGKIPILNFYEKFYLPSHQDNGFLEDELKRAEKTVSAIIERIEETSGETSVDISDLTQYEIRADLKSSFGVYIQTEDTEFKNVVINSFAPGYGASISRFLNSLPEKYADEMMTYNDDLLEGKVVVEIKDASIHNVGTFPKLTKELIDLCDDKSFGNLYRMISLSEIFVRVNESKDLILVNREDKELQILNFSLEDLKRKSAFYRFIDIFNDTDLLGLNYLLMGTTEFFENRALQGKIVSIPRIKFKERLILQRRKWLVLKSMLLNIVSKAKENGENYLNLNCFRIENEIPEEVFIKFTKRNFKNLQDDKYKPQYFNFKIPVFTVLFVDQLSKATDIIEISEMFPTSDSVMKTGGKVKEYVFNCN